MLPEADRQERATEILVSWREQRERGDALGADELIRLHPDLVDELREGLAAYALLDDAFAQMEASVAIVGGATTTSNHCAPSPDRIGDYRIVREIARGGMGIVYEAEELSMRRRVALKVLYPGVISDPKSVHRFQREAQAAGRLHHTNIVPVYGLGTDGGTWFYAMELVEGRPLHQIVADLRRLEGERNAAAAPESASAAPSSGFGTGSGAREEYVRIARAFAGVADALATAHNAGVIHRDVKPANILLDANGTLKVLDFGLARIQDDGVGVTKTGDIVGTPAYMSPEQARSGVADARSDVYSLGATMYEVLTRRPPFEGKDVGEVWRQVLRSDPPPPRRWNRRIPRDLETIVVKAMEKDPGRRYATAAAMAHDLFLFAEGAAIRARRVGPFGHAWRIVRRNRLRSALAGSVVVLAAATATLLVQRAREEARRINEQYDSLLDNAQALLTSGATTLNLSGRSGVSASIMGTVREMLDTAIRIAPERPEGHLAIAVTFVDAAPQSLSALERSRSLGLPERT